LSAMSCYACETKGNRLKPGEGAAGAAVARDEVVHVPGDATLSPSEPMADAAVAIPLRRGNHAIGVLALYGRGPAETFSVDNTRLLRQVTESQRQLAHQAFHDPLTGLANRTLLADHLAQAIEGSRDQGLACLFIDLDDFKSVNDRFGHQAGDAVLVELARRLTDATREVDVVTRFGGEEFALILPKTPVQGTLRLAEKVREVVSNEPFVAGNASIPVTVSVGAAGYPDHGLSTADLLSAADAALYRAKENGRNRVEEAESGGRPTPRGAGASR
ncbi:MAG: GGDEF domain-containing protein, partial [Actinobacteria bacterium]